MTNLAYNQHVTWISIKSIFFCDFANTLLMVNTAVHCMTKDTLYTFYSVYETNSKFL